MRLVFESRRETAEWKIQFRKELRELAAAQKRTEESLNECIRSMRGCSPAVTCQMLLHLFHNGGISRIRRDIVHFRRVGILVV